MTRKPDEWMPLHIGDYHADTTHLTRDQHGAYLLILMAYWRRGGAIPADDGRLAAIVKATPGEWRKLKPVMLEFFTEIDDHWHQKRADEELSKAKRLTEAKAEAGRKGAAKKWHGDDIVNGKAYGTVMAEPSNSHRQNDAPIPPPLPSQDSSLRSESLSRDLLGDAAPPKPKSREPEGFAEFYEAFPLKKARPAAAKAWSAAVKKLPPHELVAAARRYAEARKGEDPKFTAHPATWLNQERWADEIPTARANTRAVPTVMALSADDEWRRKVKLFQERKFWKSIDGAPPPEPETSVPRHILVEFGYRQSASRETSQRTAAE